MQHSRRSYTSSQQGKFILPLLGSILLVLGIVGATYTPAAKAYTLKGPRWQGTSTTYSLDSNFTNRGANWGSAVASAAIDWTNISITPFVFNPDGNSLNRVSSGATDCAKIQLAVTNWTWTISTNFYSKAPITVSNNCGFAFWDGTGTMPSNAYHLKGVMLHELGHVQGLCHSGSAGFLMLTKLETGRIYSIDPDAQYGSAKIYSTTYNGPAPEGACNP